MADNVGPCVDGLIQRARELAPFIAAQSDNARAQRDIPAASAMAMREAGLFRLYQPVEWGGYEAEPRTFMDIQDIFSEVCLSQAWVQGVLSVQALLVAQFDPEAQADVWGEDNSAVIASAIQPTGKAVQIDGGYRISGRWRFSSGSSVADWVTVGAMLPGKDGPAPEMRIFLVPKSDYRIDDIWHTFGLRGTGSNDIVVEDAFVPTHRSYVPNMGITNFTMAERPRSPLYRLPWLPFFQLAISNLALGAGRSALRHFQDIARTRIGGLTGLAAREDPAVLQIGPFLECEISQMDMGTRTGIQRFLDHVQSDTIIPMEDALRFRTHTAMVLRRVTAGVQQMMMLAGAKGVMESEPLTQIWLDLCAAQLHPGNDPSGSAQMLGRMQLNA